jgi:hypothetical protein
MLRWGSISHDSHPVNGFDDISSGTEVSPPLQMLHPRPAWLSPFLSVFILILVFLYAPHPQPTAAQSLPDWQLPASLHAEIWPLNQDEIDWLAIDGADSASR